MTPAIIVIIYPLRFNSLEWCARSQSRAQCAEPFRARKKCEHAQHMHPPESIELQQMLPATALHAADEKPSRPLRRPFLGWLPSGGAAARIRGVSH